MKTTPRFDRAIKRLYTAFHEGTLDAFNCKACAVGNILGTGEDWMLNHAGPSSYEESLSAPTLVSTIRPATRHYKEPETNHSGYSISELKNVEKVFLTPWIGRHYYDGADKELQFKGLYNVIEYLAELDGIPNPLDFQRLFEYEKDGAPKHEIWIS